MGFCVFIASSALLSLLFIYIKTKLWKKLTLVVRPTHKLWLHFALDDDYWFSFSIYFIAFLLPSARTHFATFSAHFHHETFSRIHDWNFDIRVQTPGKLASAPIKINFISIRTFWRKSWKLTSDSPWYDACQKVMPVFSFHLKSCERREKMWEDGKKIKWT